MEENRLGPMSKQMVQGFDTSIDGKIKQLLETVSSPFKALLAHQRELAAFTSMDKDKKPKKLQNQPSET